MEENKTVVTNENFDWNAFENDLGVYSQPKEEIAAAYDKTLSNVAVGEVVEGTVTAITKREVMVNIGYKSGGEAVLKLMESGIFDKVVKVANILGCAVCGALICSYVSFNWNVVMMREGVEVFNLQTGVFDAILPNMMPLLLTMGVYGLSKKGVKSSYITFGTMLLGFVLGLLGVIA